MANVVEDKKKALDAAIAKLEKDFGKGTVMKLGDSSAHVNVETVPEPGPGAGAGGRAQGACG